MQGDAQILIDKQVIKKLVKNTGRNRIFDIQELSVFDKFRFFITGTISKAISTFGVRQNHIIVCGFPRSGTSLLYNMMSSTIEGSYKFTDFECYFMNYIHKMGDIATKAPLDVLHLEYIDELNIHKKDIFIFILIRDLREIITSRHPVVPDRYFIGYDHSWWPQDSDFKMWSYDAPGVIDIANAIRCASKMHNSVIIKYEDLVKNPDRIQKKITNKFGVKFGHEFSRYHENKTKLAYRYEGKAAAKDKSLVLEGGEVVNKNKRWMMIEHRERIVEQFSRCPELFDLLIEYGYEVNNDWYNELLLSEVLK